MRFRNTCLFALLLSISVLPAYAAERDLDCRVDQNPSGTALVAGERFQLTLSDGFELNGDYGTVTLRSDYLGFCQGESKENMNPLEEGWSARAEVTGSHCAADGFTLYLEPCLTRGSCLVQVNDGAADVTYSCDLR